MDRARGMAADNTGFSYMTGGGRYGIPDLAGSRRRASASSSGACRGDLRYARPRESWLRRRRGATLGFPFARLSARGGMSVTAARRTRLRQRRRTRLVAGVACVGGGEAGAGDPRHLVERRGSGDAREKAGEPGEAVDACRHGDDRQILCGVDWAHRAWSTSGSSRTPCG